jgi:hypothetical protein
LIESGRVFEYNEQRWEVEKYDEYEEKYICKNLDSFSYESRKFSEEEILNV